MNYTLKLNRIDGISDNLISVMKNIACDCGFRMICSKKEIIFNSSNGLKFTELINRLQRICEIYGVDYISLL